MERVKNWIPCNRLGRKQYSGMADEGVDIRRSR